MEGTLLELLTASGPFGVMAGVAFWLYIKERGRTDVLTERIFDMASAHTDALNELTKALERERRVN